MIYFAYAAITAFAVSLLLIPFIIKFSKKRNLFESPGKRRIHKKITPSLGGVAIFAGFVFASMIWMDSSHWSSRYFLLPILIIPFILGLLDDLTHLKPAAKIIGQTVTATLIFFTLDIKITSVYGLFTFGDLSIFGSYAITLFIVIFITNSFNLIDGIDGLAAVISIVAMLMFGTWFHLAGESLTALFCFTIVGAILGFLVRNWEPSKIFMGDTGSLVIGTVLSILTIDFLNVNNSLPSASLFKFMSPLAAILCLLIIPIADTVRVIIIRLSKRISPFTADKRHLHHILVRLGKSHRFAVAVLSSVQIFFIGIALVFQKSNQHASLAIVIFFATFFVITLDYIFYRYTISKANSANLRKREGTFP